MPSSLLRSAARELHGLCAVCAHEAVLAPATAARRATSRRASSAATRPASARASPSLSQHRWLSSTSPRCRSAATSSASADNDTSSSPQSTPGKAAAEAEIRTQVPASPPSYYSLFPQTLPRGPPPAGPFHIDTRALRREFLQLQAASHPDFHHHAAEAASSSSPGAGSPRGQYSAERRKAEAVSAHINAAYRTLSSPLLRAQHLLQTRFGVDLAGDEAAEAAQPDPELLMEVLDAREAIEGAEAESDLEPLRAENEARIDETLKVLAASFEADEAEAAKRETVRLRYWANIRESIDNWEPGKPVVLQH